MTQTPNFKATVTDEKCPEFASAQKHILVDFETSRQVCRPARDDVLRTRLGLFRSRSMSLLRSIHKLCPINKCYIHCF